MNKNIKFLFFAIISLIFAVGIYAQTSDNSKTLTISGLKGAVTVRRDGRGIPFIEAKSEADLYFAQGYVTASDRLWQMDLLRRVASGETAELFGKATLEEDKRWRKFGFAKICAGSFATSAPEVRAALENYARGVNAYIAGLDDKTLPPEFKILQYRPRPWQPTDSLLIGKILSDGLSTTWQQDLLKAMIPADKRAEMFDPHSNYDVLLFGKDSRQLKIENGKRKIETESEKLKTENKNRNFAVSSNHPLSTINSQLKQLAAAVSVQKSSLARAGFYAEDLAASNNWVVSGKKTADGNPLLANDPHLQASQPSIWYLVNLSAPNLRAAGVSLPGSPGVVLGHNDSIAWGATNVGPDAQDLYLESFDAKNPLQYRTSKGEETAETRREEIKVRKNLLSPETETVALDVVTTKHGVVFYEDAAGKKYSLNWTAFNPQNRELDAFYYLNHARNWQDFQAALKQYGGAAQNFIYADTRGNIGWYAAGKIPIRKTGDGSLPYDGATDEGDWTGYIPFEELPHLYNPPQGYIVTANQRTVGDSYKYENIYARVFVPFRAARLNELLSSKPKLTIDDMSRFQFDTYSILNAEVARFITQQKGASDETLKIIANWDGRMTSDSKAALLVNAIRNATRNRILAAAFGAEQAKNIGWANEGNFFEKILRAQEKKWLPKEFADYPALFRAAEADAKQSLTELLGDDETKWTWGNASKIRFNHALAGVPLIGGQFIIPALPNNGAGGAAATPNVGQAVSMRLIAAPANWDLPRQTITTGESGNPQSAHYKDQLNDWYSGSTPVFPFTQTTVEKAASEALIMQPN
ncbi:MAG: penicillin acylase family protein [Pyrinomonadaceae bacterium]